MQPSRPVASLWPDSSPSQRPALMLLTRFTGRTRPRHQGRGLIQNSDERTAPRLRGVGTSVARRGSSHYRQRRKSANSYMKRTTKLGKCLRARRAALRLTQRSLAQKLGVEASHLALIERGGRKPSLRLVARIADSLGLERQDVLFLARPEARVLLFRMESEPQKKPPLSWQRFIEHRALLERYHVTKRELQVLEHLSLLGTAISAKEFLAILMLIRDIPERK